jgi:chemotaxis protein MotA
MDMATLAGFFGALALIGWAMHNGGSLLAYVDPGSLLIVFGGTTATVLARFRWKDFVAHLKEAMLAFQTGHRDVEPLAQIFPEWAKKVRENGRLALEPIARETKDAFLKHGIELLIDGADETRLTERLGMDSKHQQAHQTQMINMWQAWVDVAPAMGMIGTLVGLVQMLGNMSDPRSIGPAMALALLTTLYGAILAFVIAGPVVQKLIQTAKEEDQYRQTVISGLCLIARGDGPLKVMDAMAVMVAPRSVTADTGIQLAPTHSEQKSP